MELDDALACVTRGALRALGAALGVLALSLAVRAGAFVAVMRANADFSAPLAIGEFAHRFPGANVVTGRLGWWEPLWIVQALRPLPGSLVLGTWLPILVMVAVVALLVLQARRLWGNGAALIAAIAACAISADGWTNDASWAARAPTWWAMVLVGLACVELAPPASRRLRALVIALACAAAIHAGLVASGDLIAIVVTLLPLAGVLVLTAGKRQWRAARDVAGLGAVIGAGLLTGQAVAAHFHYLRQTQPVKLIPARLLWERAQNLGRAEFRLWHGPGPHSGITGVLADLVGCAGTAAVALAVVGGSVVALRAARRTPADRRGVWLAFWIIATVGQLAMFWLADVTQLYGQPVLRYLYGLPLAVAAVLAALAAGGPGLRRAVAVSTLVLGVGAAALELAVTPVPSREGASPSVARVLAIARAEGAERGFASYWTAYPLVVRSRFVLDVAPVGRCNTGEPYRLCPMYLHYIDREYEPRAPRSFLLVDTLIGKRIRAFGPAYVEVVPDNMFPRAHYDVGDGFVMYVFDGDIAQNLLPNRELDDPRAGHGGPLEPSP